MRARVEELGGRFRIERAREHGTRLVIELPQSALA
jgi:signal transduction histidine kinase